MDEAPAQRTPLIDDLPPDVREHLLPHVTRAVFAPGDVILREGLATPFLAVVVHGHVALRILVPERGPITILTAEPGDLIGWSAVVPPYRSTSTAIAVEPTELAVVEAETLRRLLGEDVGLAAGLLPFLLATVSRRLSASWLQLLDLFGRSQVDPW
jgi:CRP-like cAMP-binding protein